MADDTVVPLPLAHQNILRRCRYLLHQPEILYVGSCDRNAVVLSQNEHHMLQLQLIFSAETSGVYQTCCYVTQHIHKIQRVIPLYIELLDEINVLYERGGKITAQSDGTLVYTKDDWTSTFISPSLMVLFPRLTLPKARQGIRRCLRRLDRFERRQQQRQKRRQRREASLQQKQQQTLERQQHSYHQAKTSIQQTSSEIYRRKQVHRLLEERPDLTVDEIFDTVEREVPYVSANDSSV